MRHTTFRFCLDPSATQQVALARHAGASRFAYNVSLRLVKDSLTARHRDPGVKVPWSGFDLINQFNAWKKTEAAGRVVAVNPAGVAEVQVTGLAWRVEVCQQVFEEAAVDLGRALAAFTASRRSAPKGRRALNVEAADLNDAARHRPSTVEANGHVGVDLGLHALAVAAAADGVEVGRFDHPRHLSAAVVKQVRLARAVTRKQKGSRNRQKAAARLGRRHQKISNRRHHALHQVANAISRYPRVALEDLNVAGMLGNHQLARAISDAAWAELGRMLIYKQQWRGGRITVVDRWFPSSKTCSSCGAIDPDLTLRQRTYQCRACGLKLDRDLNAAINLAAWADAHAARDREATGPDTNARGEERSDRHVRAGATILGEAGTRHAAA
jgi:IS605 OrfB family transposase